MSRGVSGSLVRAGAVEIRPFDPADGRPVWTFIRQVLDGQGESDVATAGRSGVCAHITWQEVSERARMHMTFVAWQGLRPVGLLGLDEAGLVSMFFVRRGEAEGSHGLGVAMALMARAEEACTAAGKREIMVHSSPRAQTFYEWLGFGATDGPQEAERFVFVPMAKRL